jgi:uncharacterized protein
MQTTPSRFIRHDLMCTDVPAGRRFYTELFGWRTTELQVMGQVVVRLSAGERTLGAIIPFDARLGFPSHWVSYIAVDSVEECCRRITELGGDVCMGAMQIPPGRFAMVNDPQKALFSPFTPTGGIPAGPEPPAGVGEFSWDELLTTDVDGARSFYTALFGWGSAERKAGASGGSVVFLRSDRAIAGVTRMTGDPEQPPIWLPHVAVADVRATAARARELGALPTLPPTEAPGPRAVAILRDPTGARLAVSQSSSSSAVAGDLKGAMM